MKTIEDLLFKNMPQIYDYVEGRMTVQEQAEFQQRLQQDPELYHDYLLVNEALNERVLRHEQRTRRRSEQVASFTRRQQLGRQLMNFGLTLALAVSTMILLCVALILAIN